MVNNDDIINEISTAINQFGGNIPELEKRMLTLLDDLTKQLDVKGGKVLANVNNLKLIANLSKKLNKIVLNNDYLKNVKGFIKVFDTVTNLQNEYFSQFNEKYSPLKTIEILKQVSIDSALDSLTDSGLSASVSKPIADMLKTSITSGGSYSELVQNLRSNLMSSEDKPSILQRYIKTVTVDSISQFNGANMQLISSDINFSWFRYSGSKKTTSREFCRLLVEKEWIHKSELPTIIKGYIEGHKCKINPKTDLPLGMMEGTNASNFMERRGGYNCQHQLIPVPESIVPPAIRAKFE